MQANVHYFEKNAIKNFFCTNQPEMVYSEANLSSKLKFEANLFLISIDQDHKRKFSTVPRAHENLPRGISPSVFIGFECTFFCLKANDLNFVNM